MAVFLRGLSAMPFAAVSTVTLTGQVVDADEEPISRVVVAFSANNFTVSLGVTASDPDDGTFSFALPGTAATEFACVVQGEAGENCVVHSHKTAD